MIMAILSDASLTEADLLLRLPPDAMTELREAAAIVREHATLLELLRQCEMGGVPQGDAAAWKSATEGWSRFVAEHASELRAVMGERAGMFPVLMLLGTLEWTREYYHERGISESVLVETMSDLTIWMRHYRTAHGVWGLDNVEWLLNHFGCRLFRLGRLQFIHITLSKAITVLRESESGAVALISEPGIRYTGEGRVEGTNGRIDSEGGWTASFLETEEAFEGHPIGVSGLAASTPIRLSKTNWTLALRRGDPVLDVHIPEGEPLQPEACEAAFERALAFFGDKFPEKPVRGFVCASWLLDSQLADILPENSNIAAFQRLMRLFPVASDDRQTLERVFGTDSIDLASADRSTGLRRAIISYMEAGRRLHSAGGIRLA